MSKPVSSIVVRGTNGYDLHAEVAQDGTVTFRVRSQRTGKVQANVVTNSDQGAFLASWVGHDVAQAVGR